MNKAKKFTKLESVSFFFPAYNEEENIAKCLMDGLKVLKTCTSKYELIVVLHEDSIDKTRDVVTKLAKKYPEIKLKRYGLIMTYILSIAFMIIFASMTYQPLGNPGMMNPYFWESYEWIQDNTPENAEVLVSYADQFNQAGFGLAMGRRVTRIEAQDFAQNFAEDKSVYSLYHFDEHACATSYFDEKRVKNRRNFTYIENKDICDYEYLYFLIEPRASMYPELIQYNIVLWGNMLEAGAEEIYNNQVVSVIKNNKIGEDCLET